MGRTNTPIKLVIYFSNVSFSLFPYCSLKAGYLILHMFFFSHTVQVDFYINIVHLTHFIL